MVGQLPGRAADREVLQDQRLGLAHAFDLPRGAAGRVGLVGQAQQLIQQPHGGIAQLAGGGVGGVVPGLVHNGRDGVAHRAAVNAAAAEIIRDATYFQPHQRQKAVCLHGVGVNEKLQRLVLAAGQVEVRTGHSKADGGMTLRHDGILCAVRDGASSAAAEVKDEQPRPVQRGRAERRVQPGEAELHAGCKLPPVKRGCGDEVVCFHVWLYSN